MRQLDYQAIRRRCAQRADVMRREFDNIKSRLRDIAENVLPAAVRGIDDEVENYSHRAKKEDTDGLVCTIPLEALRKGAAGFLVNLMNPARKWYHLRVSDAAKAAMGIDGDKADKLTEQVQKVVDEVMHASGSYVEFKRCFEHLLAFGFAAMVVRADDEFIAKAECLRVGTYALGADHNGRVVRLYRRFAMTPEEIVREFGNGPSGRAKLPERILEAWRRGDISDRANVVVSNLIEPNEDTFKIGSDERLSYGVPKGKSYRSIYWIDCIGSDFYGKSPMNAEVDTCGILDIRGFRFNPIIAPRLSTEMGDIYGRGRGEDALNSCRAIQALRMDELEISSNRAEPPVIASNELREEGLGLGRGEVTYANLGEQRSQMVVPVLPNPPTSDETRQTLIELTQEVRACFFNDEFATIDSLKLINDKQKRTAAEINALTSENMLLLAGIILMLDHELLDPVVKTFTSHVLESSKLDLGVSLPDGALGVQYVSNLHMAQLTQEVNSIDASVARAVNLKATGDPKTAGVLDHFDFDLIVRRLHTLVGASQEFLLPMDAVNKARLEEAAKQREAEQAAIAKQEAELRLQEAKAAAQQGRAASSAASAAQILGDPAAQMGGYVA